MSSLTNFLKLFKWDTKTDGSEKFNIDKCMNENWDKLDTGVKAVDDKIDNLSIGGRNLLLDSKREITNSSYIIAEYTLTEKPVDGEEYTLTLKGSLGDGKTAFRIFNSGGSVNVTSLVYDNEKDIYKSTFNWTSVNSNGTTADNTFIRIYAANSSVTAESSIKWVKLEKGNKNTDWTPAPEDKANLTDLDTKMNLHRDTKALTKKGWYRVAEFVNTGIYIVNITQRYNNMRPSNFLLLVAIGSNKFNISILDSSTCYDDGNLGISQARIVKDVNSANASAFLEIYYNYNVSNNITVQVINENINTSSVNTIHFIETTDENIFIKATKDMRILHLDDAINTNKTAIGTLSNLKTSTKVDLVTSLNRLVGEELWTNPDITTNFAGQTITLSNGISNYNYYEILYSYGYSSTTAQKRTLSTGRIPKSKFAYMQVCSNLMFFRVITALSGTSMTFDDCKYYADYGNTTFSTDNSKIIPYKVIGYKD